MDQSEVSSSLVLAVLVAGMVVVMMVEKRVDGPSTKKEEGRCHEYND